MYICISKAYGTSDDEFPQQQSFNNFRFMLLTEFLFIVLPLELVVTVLNQHSPQILAATSLLIVLLTSAHLCNPSMRTAIKKEDLLNVFMKTAPFISYFRGYTNLFTGLSIFAVDFVIYPAYFFKSRAYGTSLMDTGLGFYMISNAIVSKEARGIVNAKRYIPISFIGHETSVNLYLKVRIEDPGI